MRAEISDFVMRTSAPKPFHSPKQISKIALFPLSDLCSKSSERRDRIHMNKLVNFLYRCFGGIIRPLSLMRLEQFFLAHGINHRVNGCQSFI